MSSEQIASYQVSLGEWYELEKEKDKIAGLGLHRASSTSLRIRRKYADGSTSESDVSSEGTILTHDKKRSPQHQLLSEGGELQALQAQKPTAYGTQPTRLSQCLPKVESIPPSQFANFPQSYRRVSKLLPVCFQRQKPKSPGFSKEDSSACSRPKMYRQVGATEVPKVGRPSSVPGSGRPDARTHEILTAEAETSGLEEVRARLRPTQTCKCCRCIPPREKLGGAISRSGMYVEPSTRKGIRRDPRKNFEDPVYNDAEEMAMKIPAHHCEHYSEQQARSRFTPWNGFSKSEATMAIGDMNRTRSFVHRVEVVKTLLDIIPMRHLTFFKRSLIEILQHVIVAMWRAPPAFKGTCL